MNNTNNSISSLLYTGDNLPFFKMTDVQFQRKLEIQRLKTTSILKNKLGTNDGIFADGLYMPTNDQYYRVFINDVLSNIRNGNIDFCYKWYQIKELLKFHKSNLECHLRYYNDDSDNYYFTVQLSN